ncbi:GntR family transcriptional regulator [Paenalkalicoccus suaedae]|uniref:GntR family transcriptional regulator n=1 Tax=Paenalkalicoccus suaedae TaxID=2592382 RepID=A0A859FJI0_9BACI|nr:GntR family transcriptional regulator [Paenalkalicoccus suaedae]QKS72961.1 GntR family transcriptional regulator [Paenalkalicoccus suaedae]
MQPSYGKPKQSIRESIYKMMRDKILTMELEPGRKLSEKEWSQKLEVSRTPVREAFLKLSEEGLLDIVPQSGSVVARIDLAIVEEGRFVREQLETAIVREACHSLPPEFARKIEENLLLQDFNHVEDPRTMFTLDEAFHQLLFLASKKGRSWEMSKQMNTQFERIRMLRLRSESLDWGNLVEDHKEIFRLILEKDEIAAAERMKQHLRLVDFEKGAIMSEYPNYFITHIEGAEGKSEYDSKVVWPS